MEIFKDVIGYEGLYKIGNCGIVISCERMKLSKNGSYSRMQQTIKKPNTDKDGYLYVNLSKNDKNKTYKIHRLVAIHFIPNPNNYPIINHKDETKDNNNVDNLEWCTVKYNNNYGTIKQKKLKGELHPFYGKPAHNRKPILQYTKGGEFVKEWLGAFEIEKELGIAGTKIAAVCKGKRKSAGGYKWKYKNE